MKIRLISFLICCLLFSSCSTQPTNVETETHEPETEYLLQYIDFTGESIQIEDLLCIKNNYVYARKTSGLFIDNKTNPDAFDDNGKYILTLDQNQQPQWYKYSSNRNFENFRLNSAMSEVVIENNYQGNSPHYQKVYLQDVVLNGILKYCTESVQTGNQYAMNYQKGDLIFYPYPNSLGDFPFIDVDYIHTPLEIQSTSSNYSAVADTIPIKLGNLDMNTIVFSDSSSLNSNNISDFYTGNDLVDVEIHLSKLVLEYNYDAPVQCEAKLEEVLLNHTL